MKNNNTRRTPQIGEIYLMKFDGTGSEQTGWRPGVVFQNNIGNVYSPNVIALPLTSSIKKSDQPTHVFVSAQETGLNRDSVVLCENPERMSKAKIGKYLTKLPDEYIGKLAESSLIANGAVAFLDVERLLSAWSASVRLNSHTVS